MQVVYRVPTNKHFRKSVSSCINPESLKTHSHLKLKLFGTLSCLNENEQYTILKANQNEANQSGIIHQNPSRTMQIQNC